MGSWRGQIGNSNRAGTARGKARCRALERPQELRGRAGGPNRDTRRTRSADVHGNRRRGIEHLGQHMAATSDLHHGSDEDVTAHRGVAAEVQDRADSGLIAARGVRIELDQRTGGADRVEQPLQRVANVPTNLVAARGGRSVLRPGPDRGIQTCGLRLIAAVKQGVDVDALANRRTRVKRGGEFARHNAGCNRSRILFCYSRDTKQ